MLKKVDDAPSELLLLLLFVVEEGTDVVADEMEVLVGILNEVPTIIQR